MNLSAEAKAVILAAAKRVHVEQLDYIETPHGLLVNRFCNGVWLCEAAGVSLCSAKNLALVLHIDMPDWNVWACEQGPATRYGRPTYAGAYRLAYAAFGLRFLEVRRASGFQRIEHPLPPHVRGAYAAAVHFGV